MRKKYFLRKSRTLLLEGSAFCYENLMSQVEASSKGKKLLVTFFMKNLEIEVKIRGIVKRKKNISGNRQRHDQSRPTRGWRC